MKTTRFDTRSSEWIGDMTAWMQANAEDNSLQLERMKRNLRVAREKELTPRQQYMLELYYDQEMSVTEIAQELCVNVSRFPARCSGHGIVFAVICNIPFDPEISFSHLPFYAILFLCFSR